MQARACAVSASDISCDTVNACTTPLVSTALSASGDSDLSAQTQTDGNYVSWPNTNSGTFTIASAAPSGYALRAACWQRDITFPTTGNGVTSSFSAQDETLSWNLGYSLQGPWAQTGGGGDVYGSGILQSYISQNTNPRFFSLTGVGGSPGVVTYGGSYDFDPDINGLGESYVSSTGWLINQSDTQTDYYQEFYSRFGSPTPTATGNIPISSQLAGSADPYYYNGNVTINGAAWNIPNGASVIVFVSGNLTIQTPILITPGGFIAFIVNGDISIDPSVGVPAGSSNPVLEGVYITSPAGIFFTCDPSSGISPCPNRFVGHGMFIAGGFSMNHDLASSGRNNDTSAELFLYYPQLLLTMPDKMKDIPITWQEVAP